MNKQEKKIWAKPELIVDEIESTDGGRTLRTLKRMLFTAGGIRINFLSMPRVLRYMTAVCSLSK